MNATLTAWIAANSDKFETSDMLMIKQKLEHESEDKAIILHSVKMKDPTTGFWMCLFLGWLGLHWFWVGESGKGIILLITNCLCGLGIIFWIADLFRIKKAIRQYNYRQILPYL
jgi:TM2 domain-containing membrane protein YozV